MEKLEVAIVGAGLGGLCAAIKLLEAGTDNFLVFDRNEKVGGVWHENKYPGCCCDTPVALYEFSFAPGMNWSHLFPRAAQVQTYAQDIADSFQITSHLRLGDGVKSAIWDEANHSWHLTTESGKKFEANAIIAAMGQLNRPAFPEIEGRDTFSGPVMHSARWDSSVSLKDKRVGVIGSAASAVQLIPEVAKVASQLTVFQRTPNWVIPRFDREVTIEDKALAMSEPAFAMDVAKRNRQLLYDNADHFFWKAFEWTPEGRTAFTKQASNHLEAQIPDAVLRAQLTPDYPIGCKRILITDDFYPTLMKDNVSLETNGIAKITSTGVETTDGAQHECDVLIFATGFETTGWRWSMEVTGQGGQQLNALWEEAPEAYLGITAFGFPNLFVLYGPNTNLGHNTITFMLEQQVAYTMKALASLKEAGVKALMPSKAAQDRFNKQIQADLSKTVWADPDCASWYKDAQGRITQNWSSHTRDYAEATSKVDLADYELIG